MSGRSRPPGVDSQLRYRGLEIAMRVQGDGEPLLLINGLTRPLDSWEPFTRERPRAASGRCLGRAGP
jgi:hypothetical protein